MFMFSFVLRSDQSWPLESIKYPDFAAKGRYCPRCVFTPDVMKGIVQHGVSFGVRVMLEFDMPAHSSIWANGYPDLVITCDEPDAQPLLDPTGPVYEVLDNLLTEFAGVQDAGYVHLGGDEVHSYACWNSSAKVQAYMKKEGIPAGNMTALREHFQYQVQLVVQKHGLNSVFWQEVFEVGTKLLNTTVINSWSSAQSVLDVARAGQPVIQSDGFYLDQQRPRGENFYFLEDTFFAMYGPVWVGDLEPEYQKNVLGVSGCQWGEQVDSYALSQRLWPRASAIAERAWSPASVNSTDPNVVIPRVGAMRCELLQRGVYSTPLRPSTIEGYCPLPYGESRR